jgi:anti-sigma regulatory factor (Ser/Thr protein kinase)
MKAFTKKYTDLDRAIDEVRSLSDEWQAAQHNGSLDDETIHCACLVLHEWVANLHQHAQFGDASPTIEVQLSAQDRRVSCSVTDNSEGFELESHLPADDDDLESLPERGMGLRIIESCTNDFSYTPTEDGHHRFEFIIPDDHDPWLNTLF